MTTMPELPSIPRRRDPGAELVRRLATYHRSMTLFSDGGPPRVVVSPPAGGRALPPALFDRIRRHHAALVDWLRAGGYFHPRYTPSSRATFDLAHPAPAPSEERFPDHA